MSRINLRFFNPLVFTLLLFTSCVSTPTISNLTPEQIASKTLSYRDEFRKETYLTSMIVWAAPYDLVNQYTYQIRAQRRDGNPVEYFLVFASQRGNREGWAFWTSIINDQGKEILVFQEARNVLRGGITQERVTVRISRDFLQKTAKQGAKLRIYGHKIFMDLLIAPNFAQGLLQRFDAEFNSDNTVLTEPRKEPVDSQ